MAFSMRNKDVSAMSISLVRNKRFQTHASTILKLRPHLPAYEAHDVFVSPEDVSGRNDAQKCTYVAALCKYFENLQGLKKVEPESLSPLSSSNWSQELLAALVPDKTRKDSEDSSCFMHICFRRRVKKINFVVRFNPSFLKELQEIFPAVSHSQLDGAMLAPPRLVISGEISVTGLEGVKMTTFHKENYYYAILFPEAASTPGKAWLLDDSIKEKILRASDNRRRLMINCSVNVKIDWRENTMLNMNPTVGAELSETKDFTLVAGDGEEVQCHKNLLIAESEAISIMLSASSDCAMKESQSGVMEMPFISGEALKLFVKLLYERKIPTAMLTCDATIKLLRNCHMYEIGDFIKSLVRFLRQRNYEWFTGNGIVELYAFLMLEEGVKVDEDKDLRKYLLKMMERKSDEIQRSENYVELKTDGEQLNHVLWDIIRQKK